ncbi:MAG TPA: PKD domain-containing protein [Anaerolineae bacterium]|nr:PKD domain-containing protein [Anaerolineae bacterium]HQI86868.1 PKD domain-containing protein [Anaerolineae bacterium]
MNNKTRLLVAALLSLAVIALTLLMSQAPVTGREIGYAVWEAPTQSLSVTKRASAAFVPSGGQLTYTLAVTNTGDVNLTATITDILPANVTLGGTPGGTIIMPPGWIVWSPVALAPHEVWIKTVVVTVTASYAGPLTNTVQVATLEGASGTATAVVTAEQVIAGLTVRNDGPTPLGSPTTLTATLTSGSHVTYDWYFGDGVTLFGAGPVVTHTYPYIGPYMASVMARNDVSAMGALSSVTIRDAAITGLTAVNSSPTWLGYATTLTATVATGSNVTYHWNFGDGQTGSGAVVSHVYPSLGTYTAVVTASNSLGGVSAATSVTITAVPVTGLAVINDSPTLIGDVTTFTATVATGENVTYAWAFGDGATGSGAVVTHTYPALGFYTAIVTATNNVNSMYATSRVTITDGSITGLTARNSSPTWLGYPTTLTATVATGKNVTYLWAFGDGALGNGPVVAHTYPHLGTYTAVVTASNSLNVVTATTIVTITAVPVTGLTAANDSPTMIGAPTTLTATATTGENITYAWTFGDGASGSGRVVTHVYPRLGFYTAIVTASNSVSVIAATTRVTITDGSITGLIAVNSSPTRLGATTKLTATVATGSNVAYFWNFGDGKTASGALASHVYSSIGTYTAMVTASNSLGGMSAATVVTILDAPVTGLVATNDGPTPLGYPTTLHAVITAGSNVTYTWDFGDGGIGYGKDVKHTYPAYGTYTAIVRASNSVGTPQTAFTQVRVVARIYLPLVLKGWSPPPVTPTPTPTITPTPTVTPTPGPQDVVVLANHSHYTSGSTLYIIGEAENRGSAYASNVTVPVRLLGSSGNLLATYYTLTKLDLPAGEKSCFQFVINGPPTGWTSIQFGTPTYITPVNYQPWANLVFLNPQGEYLPDLTYKITGSVGNAETRRVESVMIEGALYTANGTIVGCRLSMAAITTLDPGATSPFELLYGSGGDYSGVVSYRLQADGYIP